MKKRILTLGVAALLLAALVLSGCAGNKADPQSAPPAAAPENYDEATLPAFQKTLNDLAELKNVAENGYLRGVTSPNALASALELGSGVRYASNAADAVVLPAGNYADKEILFDAANAGFTSDAALGTLLVNAAGGDGVNLKGHVGTLAVYGENVTVTLSGGADTVYVQGKNCTVRLAGGAFGQIVCVNQTAVIENATDTDVTVYVGTGAKQTLAAGGTLSFE